MRLEIGFNVNGKSYISKLGYLYPIHIYNKNDFKKAVNQLTAKFGDPARQYHFTNYGGKISIRSLFESRNISDCKWYADSRRWHPSRSVAKKDFWIVFKEDRDRTLALMLLS